MKRTILTRIAAFLSLCALALCVRGLDARLARAGEVANAYEGTFTPTIVGLSTAGTATYTVQVGRYSRIGNRVSMNATITYTAGNGTGQPAVAGLPLALRSVSNNDTACSVLTSSFTFGAGQVAAAIASGESQVRLWLLATGSALAAASYDGAASVFVQCSYEVTP